MHQPDLRFDPNVFDSWQYQMFASTFPKLIKRHMTSNEKRAGIGRIFEQLVKVIQIKEAYRVTLDEMMFSDIRNMLNPRTIIAIYHETLEKMPHLRPSTAQSRRDEQLLSELTGRSDNPLAQEMKRYGQTLVDLGFKPADVNRFFNDRSMNHDTRANIANALAALKKEN